MVYTTLFMVANQHTQLCCFAQEVTTQKIYFTPGEVEIQTKTEPNINFTLDFHEGENT